MFCAGTIILGLTKSTASDYAGIKRVHNIFDRAVMKHRGDIELWLQYVEFCKNSGSGKILSKLFSRYQKFIQVFT